MTTGTGTLYLQGTSAQNVNGTQTFFTYNLTSNNSSGITLNNSLSVGSSHTFSNGLITTSGLSHLIYQSGATYSGDNDSKHVNGWVEKLGSQDFDFPVGNATIERKAGIRNLTASSSFQCQYLQNTPNRTQLASPLVSVNSREYWYIDKNSGGQAQVILNWDNSKVQIMAGTVSLPDIRVAHYTNSLWNDAGARTTGNIVTSGTVTSDLMSSFSPFAIGTDNTVLPVTFLYFTAAPDGTQSDLSWATGSEQMNDHFEVQRSLDNANWEYITSVKSSGNKAGGIYTAIDPNPEEGINFYRLKQVNQDGTFAYSTIAYCKFAGKNNSSTDNSSEEEAADDKVTLLNSTNSPSLQIITPSAWESSEYTLSIYNVSGQLVKDIHHFNMGASSSEIVPVDLGLLPSGMYVAVLSNNTQ